MMMMVVMMMMFVVMVIITALHQRRACESPSVMPTTRLFLLRPFSLLLLLLGPHFFVGSFSLGSASSPSPTERSSVATAGPRAVVSIRGGSTFLAASSSLLPREKGSPQPSAASVSVWDRTTDRGGGSDSPAVMTRQKDVENPNTEAKISTSYIRSLHASSTSGNDKVRTFWTNLASASVAATRSTTSYTKLIRSVNVTPQLSQMTQTKRASASPNMVGIASSESVTLRKHFPKTANSPFLEKKHPAIENYHHTASTWNEDSTTSSFHTPGMDSSATLSQSSERTSRFFRENFTGNGPATPKELATSSGQIQWSPHVTLPIPQSRTSNAKQPDSLTRIVLTRSYTSPQTNTHQLSRNSNIERRISRSDMEYMTLLNISNKSEEKIFQTIRDISSSQDPHSKSAVSNLEMSTSGEKILRTVRDISSSQGPHSTSAVSNLEISTNGKKTLQTLSDSRGSPNPHSVSTIPNLERSTNGEKILRTVRDISSSRGSHSTSAVSNLEISTNGKKILQTLSDSRGSPNPHSVSTIPNLERSTNGEKILRTVRDISSSQGPHSTSAVSNLEISTNGKKILRTLRDSRGSQNLHSVSTIANLEISANGEKLLRTLSDTSRSQGPHSTSAVSNLEISANGEKILQTLRDISRSPGPHSTFAVSKHETSTNGEMILRTLRDTSRSQGPHSKSAVSNLEISTNGEKILRTLRDSRGSQNLHSVSTIPNLEISTNGKKIIQTLRDIGRSQGPHSKSAVSNLEISTSGENILQTVTESRGSQNPRFVSTIPNLEMSGSSGPNDSSYVVVPADSQQMELSTQDTVETKATDRHSQSLSATTAVEDTKQMNSRSNTERKMSSSYLDSVTVSRVLVRDEKKSKNITQTFATTNTSSSSRLSSRPEKTEEMDLLHRDFVVTKEAFTFSQASTEQNDQQQSSLDMESITSNFHTEKRSDRSGKRIIGHTSSSYHPESLSTASQSEIPSSSALTDSSSVLTPIQTRQKDLPPGFTNVMEAESTHPWDSSQATAAEDSHLSSSNKEKISTFQRDGVSVSSLSKRGEDSTLRTVRDVSSFESDTQTPTVANATISGNSDVAHSFHVKTPEEISPDLSPEDTDFTEGMLIPSQAPSKTTVKESGQSSTEGIFSTYHLNNISISVLSGLDGKRTLRTPRDVSDAHNVTQGSIAWHNVTSSSSGLTGSSYLLTPVETDLTPQTTDFTEGTSTHLQASSEKAGVESSSSNIETRFSHSDQDSASVSSSSDRDKEITLQTLREVKNVYNITQTSSSMNDNITSSFNIADSSYTMTPKHTREMNLSSGNNDFTEEALIYSEAPSETTDTRSRHHALSNFNIEKKATQTESMFSSTVIKDETFVSLTNQSRSIDTTELSVFDAGSSVIIQTSSATSQGGNENSPSTETEFTETLEQSLHTTSSKASGSSSSTKDFSSSTDHFQTIKGSEAGRRFSIASTDSVYLSTTFVHGAERTLRSLPDNSTSDDAADSNPYSSQTSKSSEESLTLSSEPETETHNVSLSEVQSIGPSTEYSLDYSSGVPTSLSPNDSASIGSHDNSTSGPRVLHSRTISTDSSAPFSEGEEQTTQPTINATVMEETESVSSHMENVDSTRSKPSSSKTYSRMTDLSLKDLDISPSSTEALQILSSSTYSSPKSELSDTGTEYQPMSSTDFGKQTSVSHTDSTYTLTTFAKGGERTLLSLPNNNTSADSSGSSTYSAEISSASESVQSFFSSDMDFSENSTEPLAVHSLKTSEYSSTVSEADTTQYYSESESASTGSLSFSSSSTRLSEQDSLPPVHPSTFFSSAKSSVPSSFSASPLPLSSSPPTSLMTFSPMFSSTEPTTLPFFPSVLPSLSTTPLLLQPGESLETSVSMTEPEGTTGAELRTTGSSHGEYSHPTTVYPLANNTILRATGTSLLTEITEQTANRSFPRSTSQEETKGQTLTLPGISTENEPITTTSSPYFQEMTTTFEPAKATTAVLLHTIPQKDTFPSSTVTMGKKPTEITFTPGRLPTSASTMNYLFTTKVQKVPLPSPTEISSTGIPTKMMEKSSTTTVKTKVPEIVITSSPYTLTSHKTTLQSFPASLVPSRPTTAVNLGSSKISPTLYGKDVDECLSNPCPSMATCINVQGSFQCICSLGYQMAKGKCNLVRTFVGHFPLMFNTTGGTYSELHQIEGVIINLLNESLSTFPGYYTSTVKASRQEGVVQISILSTFSMASNITFSEVIGTVRSRIRACKAPTLPCQFISNLTQLYRVGGLCKHKDPECDKGTSVCVDLDGIAVCQCKPGYFKYNKLDHSCRACEDGYKLENDTCVSCPFGLGGFNCRNPYQLITIVIAAAGGGLLLIMGIALIVTCCQKNKNDISKLIFKSGDFQMSPYAEYPKNPRVQDWSRETIEMQENGSTKNLLQMTDVYYMPANLRNPELERNGIYPPYTGLPGSRHSCIYPGQYNPSFISDDSRRRDYF
ncbi:protein HEG homolog 1 isoform X2 [Crotalus tigris]|uniref:protein HEG homolog 1 isoform X2 n=1 Tax=Crotalus tigris TaxID=88082 RepID=UPI00192F3170|nr:protein HEG homolog 1 isoform X2 [Crotalus tigris]